MRMNRMSAVASLLAGFGLIGSALTGCSSSNAGSSSVLTEAEREYVAEAFAQKNEKYQTRGPKPFDNPDKAIQFFLEQRLADGMDQYPVDLLEAAHQQMRLAEQAVQRRGGELPGDLAGWQEIGPGNIGGRTRAIAINPENPDILFAGGVAGGVWKSVDAGQFWVPTGDSLPNLAVTDIVIDPLDSNVMYFSTGEGFFNGDAVRGLGIFRSTDAGDTWEQLANTSNSNFFYVNKLAIAETTIDGEPGVEIIAAARSGVWRSIDNGQTWNALITNPFQTVQPGVQVATGSGVGFTDVAIGDDYVLAAAGSFSTDGVYRAERGSGSWTNVLNENDQGRATISISPTDPDIIYLGVATADGNDTEAGRFKNVFRSLDGGLTWSERTNLANETNQLLFSNLPFGNGCFGFQFFSQGWYDNIIKVDPVDPNIVWIGGIDLFRSDDGGQNFQLASYWYFDPTDPNYVHADHHALVFHPDYNGTTNQILYSGSDGGLARTDNARDVLTINTCPVFSPEPLPQVTWTQLNNNYGVTQFYHGDVAREQDIFIGGTQDNGTLRGNTRDVMVDWDRIFGGDGGYVAIDPFNSNVVYAETQNFPRIRKSVDGGENFQLAVEGITDEDGLFITPFAMDQNNPEILWTGGSRIWRTTNGAASWERIGNRLAGNVPISAIGISPGTSDVVYIGYANGAIARSTNASAEGASFEIVSESFQNPIGFISSIAVDPTDPNTVYATVSSFGVPHVWRSTDGGTNWNSIDGIGLDGIPDIPVNVLAIRPTNSQQLYAGTDIGVFVSDDFGATWSPASSGMANTVVEWLDFRDRDTIVAFTHGRSAFLADLTPRTSIEIVPTQPLPQVLQRNENMFVEVRIDVVEDSLVDAPRVFYRPSDRDTFFSLPLVSRGNDIFDAVIPGFECHSDPEYFISVTGVESGEVRLPPVATVQTEVVENISVFFDDGETDAGWTISGDATDGVWERGFPDNNNRADPATDFDGTGRAWLTDIDPNNENSDIDNGSTILTSPELNIPRGAVFSFAYWFNATQDSGVSEGDMFLVEVSTDNFQDPANTYEIFRSETPAEQWRTVSLVAGQDGFELNPTGSEWIRVIASDVGTRNIVEAGLDAVDIGRRTCELCLADANQDGRVNGTDFGAWLGLFNAGDPRADVNLDEQLNGLDFTAWLQGFEFGCD